MAGIDLQSEGIKNIIFDLGGVILNIDTQLTVKGFQQIIGENIAQVYDQLKDMILIREFERGQISPNEFRAGLRSLTSNPLTDEEIDDAWNAMILNIPSQNIQFLEQLKQTHQTFLLSNTNPIHIHYFQQIIQQEHSIGDFSQFFHGTYYSHEVKMRKPDAEIFNYVLEKHQLNPGETLFIDDFPENVEGAIQCGLKGYQIQPGETLPQIFY